MANLILSDRSKVLWAKASNRGEVKWTPLYIHMIDSAKTCSRLWDSWIPDNVKKRISEGIRVGEDKSDETTARKLCIFVSAAHDVGKAIPAFQGRRIQNNKELTESLRNLLHSFGLVFRTNLNDPGAIPHSMSSEMIVEKAGISRTVAIVVGGHHGLTPTRRDLRLLPDAYPDNTGFDSECWTYVQKELVEFCTKLSGLGSDDIRSITVDPEAQVLLTGIVVVSDWIASNEMLFPLLDKFSVEDNEYEMRLRFAEDSITLPSRWMVTGETQTDLFTTRFPFQPRPFQKAVEDAANSMERPGLMILEAPMGEGKTEAALVAAEIMMGRFGLGGLMFALPTQATADGLFPRIRGWLESASADCPGFHTVFLAHGKSRFNTDYRSLSHIDFGQLPYGGPHDVVHNWFTGKRKGILSDFVIGTVDQVLMMGLKQRHAEMRHLGLAGKVVVIDECHAYDAYMGSYLEKTLKWLGAYGVPTILLSATLPPERRRALLSSYMGGLNKPDEEYADAYPCVTITDGKGITAVTPQRSNRTKKVSIRRLSDDDLVPRIIEMSANGGYVGVIVNTVKRAQMISERLCKLVPVEDVRLLHSGFMSMDRSVNETEVVEALSRVGRREPPFRMIVVGTQVMEQSMDLDFDVMFTDLCPVDLLLQRIGRLHRHDNPRPVAMSEPTCYVIDRTDGRFDQGSEAVYGRYQLYNTRILLSDCIALPDDIPRLVNAAYSVNGLIPPDSISDDYSEALRRQHVATEDKERRARAFQIADPKNLKDLLGWLDNPVVDGDDGEKAMATVRDGDRSVEAVLLQKIGDDLFVLPWVQDYGGMRISKTDAPSPEMAFALAGCKAPLPRTVTSKGADRIIDQLRSIGEKMVPRQLSDSEWLNGDLFLILDGKLEADVGGKTVRYNQKMGMMVVE